MTIYEAAEQVCLEELASQSAHLLVGDCVPPICSPRELAGDAAGGDLPNGVEGGGVLLVRRAGRSAVASIVPAQRLRAILTFWV